MGRSVLRRGRRARRVQVLGGRPHALPPRCATADGYTVHAGVVIGAKNREGLERLCRYIARPPLAKGRLEENPDGTLRLHLKRPWSDGTVAFTFSAAEFVERLAALIPPPHKNQVIYHGVLAPRAAWRQQVVPRPLRITDAQRKRRVADVLTRTPSRADRPRWTPWRQLLERTFGADGFGCPNCALADAASCGCAPARDASCDRGPPGGESSASWGAGGWLTPQDRLLVCTPASRSQGRGRFRVR